MNFYIFKKAYRSNFLLSVVLALIVLIIPGVTNAQGSSGIKIQPALIEDGVDPGQELAAVLRITNITTEEQPYTIEKRDIKSMTLGGAPVFAEEGEQTAFAVSSWIDLPFESVVVGPDSITEVPITIRVPEDATPGGHFGGIFFVKESDRLRETGSSVGFEVGAIIDLRVSGDVLEETQIREFRTDKRIYREGRPPISFFTKVENLGNVLVRPHGPLEITNIFGKQVAVLRVNDSGGGVVPNGSRVYETEWNSDDILFGRYQAVLSLVYGQSGRKTIFRATEFWVLPLNILLPILFGLLVLVVGIRALLRLYVKKRIKGLYKASGGQSAGNTPAIRPDLLAAQKQVPFSRLMTVAIVVLLFTLLFVVVLFFFLA